MSVFLDHAATTQLRPEALAALTSALTTLGNPSSVHSAGQAARQILEDARDTLAAAVACHRSEVIFNSGGTEADNQAVKGIYWARQRADAKRTVIISAATEHHALIDPLEWLERNAGAEIHWLPVDQNGTVDLAELGHYLDANHERVALVTLMWANNETGVITDIARVCRLASEYQIPVHSDAVAALGHLPISFRDSGLAAMSLSGHKVGAPIGVGALIVSRNLKLDSLIHGGGQERSLRSGTMNYPLAASFAEAARVAVASLSEREQKLRALRDHLESAVRNLVPDVIVTAASAERLADNAHFIFPGVLGDSLLFLLDSAGVQVSTGSACQAGVVGPSHVLIGMGYSEDLAQACIRVTLGHSTTADDVDRFLAELPAAHAAALRAGQVR